MGMWDAFIFHLVTVNSFWQLVAHVTFGVFHMFKCCLKCTVSKGPITLWAVSGLKSTSARSVTAHAISMG